MEKQEQKRTDYECSCDRYFSVTVISAAGQIGTAKINDSLDDMGVNSVLVEAQEAGAL